MEKRLNQYPQKISDHISRQHNYSNLHMLPFFWTDQVRFLPIHLDPEIWKLVDFQLPLIFLRGNHSMFRLLYGHNACHEGPGKACYSIGKHKKRCLLYELRKKGKTAIFSQSTSMPLFADFHCPITNIRRYKLPQHLYSFHW